MTVFGELMSTDYMFREAYSRGYIESEYRSLTDYIQHKDEDPLLKIPRGGDPLREIPHEEWKKNTKEETDKTRIEKLMHRQYSRQIEAEITKTTRYSWLKEVYLKIQTVALLTATQDQALNTKLHNIHNEGQHRPHMLKCKVADETVARLLIACRNRVHVLSKA